MDDRALTVPAELGSSASARTTLGERLNSGNGSLADQQQAVTMLEPAVAVEGGGAWLMLQITILRNSGYFRPMDNQMVADGIDALWFRALASEPRWAIEAAILEYVQRNGRRHPPAPGDIVSLARKATEDLRLALRAAQNPEESRSYTPPTDDERKSALALVEHLKAVSG